VLDIVKPSDYRSVARDFRLEIESMEKGKHKPSERSLNSFIENMKRIYDASRFKRNETPNCLSERNFLDLAYSVSFILEEYCTAPILHEEAETLIQCLYKILSIFVMMGVDPSEYIEELINKMEEESIKKKK
jgi:hypothetical protein